MLTTLKSFYTLDDTVIQLGLTTAVEHIIICVSVQLLLCAMRFYAQKQLLLSSRLSHRNSVRPSVRHTGGSVKSGASYDYQIFTVGCMNYRCAIQIENLVFVY